MSTSIDLAKLVDTASAPVALIIASSIFLGNLSGKYSAMFAAVRSLFAEYRDSEIDERRRQIIREQLPGYGRRLRMLIQATLWLGCSIAFFICTVLLTSITIVIPRLVFGQLLTAVSMFAGLMSLAVAVCLELREAHQAKAALKLDFDEFPELRAAPGQRIVDARANAR
jgi:MFS family permease